MGDAARDPIRYHVERKVGVITGVPGAFCAGTDLADLATIPGETRGLRGAADERHAWWPIAQARKPTIGVIDGPAR
jgi:enoyl-CoA hydratase/carnithine racemase